jgi:hypothetical protein
MSTASVRGKHDAKLTVYLTSAELLAIDQTLLEMRRVFGIKVDRSRFVREALHSMSMRTIAERIRATS